MLGCLPTGRQTEGRALLGNKPCAQEQRAPGLGEGGWRPVLWGKGLLAPGAGGMPGCLCGGTCRVKEIVVCVRACACLLTCR